MHIEGSKKLVWGKIVPAGPDSHITQTNDLSRDGRGVHITNDVGYGRRVHTRFYKGTNFNKS